MATDKLSDHIAAMAEAAHNLKTAQPDLWEKLLDAYQGWLDVENTVFVEETPSDWLDHQQGRVRFMMQCGRLLTTATEKYLKHREFIDRTSRPNPHPPQR